LFAPRTDSTGPDFRTASEVARVLADAGVGIVLLNACNTATASSSMHANLAQTFIDMGISNVLAMSYAVLAQTAEKFVQQLYRTLIVECRDLEYSVFKARQHLRLHRARRARYGLQCDVSDFFVPVLYRDHHGKQYWTMKPPEPIPDAERTSKPEHIGHDSDILALEEHLGAVNVVNLIGGGGSGKTLLAEYLSWWWELTEYFDQVIRLNCRCLKLWEKENLYEAVAAQLRGLDEATTNSNLGDLVRGRRILVVLDNGEVVEEEDRSVIPVSFLGDLATARIRLLLSEFSPPSCKSKLLVLSRTSSFYLNCVTDKDFARYHELRPLLTVEAIAIATEAIGGTGTGSVFDDNENMHLATLLELHENNPLFASSIVRPALQTGMRPSELERGLKPNSLVSEAAVYSELVTGTSDRTCAGTIADFQDMVSLLRTEYTIMYDILLTLAPFREHFLLGMRPYLINSSARKLIRQSPASLAYRLTAKKGFLAASEPQEQEEFFATHSQLLDSYKKLLAVLGACGLAERAIPPARMCSYVRIHPMLPYLLRNEMSQMATPSSFLKCLRQNFLEYFEFRTIHFPDLNKELVRWIWEKERANITNAVEICMEGPTFGSQKWHTINALHFVNYLPLSTATIDESIALMGRVLAEYERWEAFSHPPSLGAAALDDALRVAGQRINLANTKQSPSLALDTAQRGLKMFQNFQHVIGTATPINFCYEYQFDITVALYGEANRDDRRRRLKKLISAEPPKNTPQDFVFGFLWYKANLIVSIFAETSNQKMINEVGLEKALLLSELGNVTNSLKSIPEAKKGAWISWLEKFRDMALVLQDPSATHTDYLRTIPILRSMGRFIPALEPAVKAVSLGQATHGSGDEALRGAYLDSLAAAQKARDIHAQIVFHDSLFHLSANERDMEGALAHHERILQLEKTQFRTQGAFADEEFRPLYEAERYLALASIDIMEMLESKESQPDRVLQARKRIDTALALGERHGDDPLKCKALHLLARWDQNFGGGAASSMIYTTQAAMLGDNANQLVDVHFEHGRFARFLVRLWRSTQGRGMQRELVANVAAVVGWQESKLTHLISICSNKLPQGESEGYAEGDFMDEAQEILYGRQPDQQRWMFWETDADSNFQLRRNQALSAQDDV